MAHCYVVVGKTKSGKTGEALKIASKYPCREIVAYDVRRESKYRLNKSIRAFHGDEDEWLRELKKYDYLGSCRVFLCDEAGDYCPHGSKYAPITRPVRGKRFNGNVYVFMFHDLMEVPQYVIRLCDYFIVKNCRGDVDAVRKKYKAYPEIFAAWEKARSLSTENWSMTYRMAVG